MTYQIGTKMTPTPGRKRKRPAINVPDHIKLSDILPYFHRSKELPEVNTPSLQMAFADLIEQIKLGRIHEYPLHYMIVGNYGRYTVELFYHLKSVSYKAHIDIVDQHNVIGVIILDPDRQCVNSSYPLFTHKGEIHTIERMLQEEIEQVLELIKPEEEEEHILDEISA